MKKPAYILSMLLFYVFAGSIPIAGFYRTNIFYSPVFWALGALIALVPLFYQFKKRRWDRQIAYILTHYGVVLIMIGAIMEMTPLKKEGNIVLSAEMGSTRVFQDKEGEIFRLPFAVSLDKAEIEYYSPDYYEYYVWSDSAENFVMERNVSRREYEEMKLKAVEHGEFYSVFADGSHLRIPQMNLKVKEYRAYLSFASRENKEEGVLLRVNHPVRRRGYRVYLLSMSNEVEGRQVTLLVRNNPGADTALTGMVLMLIEREWS